MAFPVTLNGRTYTLTDFEGTNYVDGLPDAFEDFVTHAGDIYNSTSTTSNSIGTGSKTFTVEANKPYQAGTPLRIADAAAPSTNFLDTVVTSYSGTTLVVNSIGFGGSGTKTSWTVNIGGAKTVDGTLGVSQGGTGATTAAAAASNLGLGTEDSPTFTGLTVTGTTSFSDISITNVGDIAVDSVTGDADADTKIVFAGSDVINIQAGGSTVQSITTTGVDITGDLSLNDGTPAILLKVSGAEKGYIRSNSDVTEINGASGSALRQNGFMKLQTSATGVDITGGFTATDDSIISTDGGNPSMTVKTSGTGNNPSYILRAGDNTVFDIMGIFSSDPDYLRIGKGTTGSVDTEIAKFHVGGDVEIVNGNLVVASGHGIDFSASSNASGVTSELFSDYEEGSWTPTYTSTDATNPTFTPNLANGRYTKIGRTVIASFRIRGAVTGTKTGSTRISGLPFSASSDQSGNGGSIRLTEVFGADNYPASLSVTVNGADIILTKFDSSDPRDGMFDAVPVSSLQTAATGNYIIGQVIYDT